MFRGYKTNLFLTWLHGVGLLIAAISCTVQLATKAHLSDPLTKLWWIMGALLITIACARRAYEYRIGIRYDD